MPSVAANGSYQVKADQTREIRAVAVKTGQEVNQGDVLFILGQGDSDELEAATDALRDLEISYRKSAINMPTFDYTVEERKIASAQDKYDAAVKAEQEALDLARQALEGDGGISAEALNDPENELYAVCQKEDGKTVWNVWFHTAEGICAVTLDAADGTILDVIVDTGMAGNG